MNRFDAAKIPVPYKTPELLIFCMIGIMEACIRNRLLPHNENYADFFAGLELPVSITDKQLTPLYQTAITVTDDRDTLQQAVGTFVYPEPDTRLSCIELNAGYTFFAEDESVLHRLNEELQDANEVLSMENEVLVREQELIQEKAATEERNRLYDKAAQEIHPAQKRISALLEKLQPNTPSFRQDMARVLFMTAYVKRKANFVMLNADHGSITPEDMTVALKESLRFLNYCGIETDARIMFSFGVLRPNDVEMVLEAYSSNSWQSFKPEVNSKDEITQTVSKAVKNQSFVYLDRVKNAFYLYDPVAAKMTVIGTEGGSVTDNVNAYKDWLRVERGVIVDASKIKSIYKL